MRCPQCNGRAEHNRNRSCNQHHILRPCANQKFRTEGVIRQTDDGKHTGFYDCHGMQQSRNGCGGNGCLRQPAIKREYRRFYTKAEERQHKYQPQHLFIACNQIGIQHTTVNKICRCAVEQHKHEPDKRQRCTEHHIKDVGFPGVARLIIELVHHDGQCHQCQKFVEQIHR